MSKKRMSPARILAVLKAHRAEFEANYGVQALAVFGSTVRGSAREDSDVDIWVRFAGPATASQYFGLQFRLEDLLGLPVDLVTDRALRPELRPYIEREAVRV